MKKILLVIVALIFFYGCKRYEANPLIVFHSVRSRLNGNWKVDNLLFNNEIKPAVLDTFIVDYYNFIIASKSDKRKTNGYYDGGFLIYFQQNSLAVFTIKLSEDYKSFSIWNDYPGLSMTSYIPGTLVDTSFNYSNHAYYREEWDIVKLTNNELWIKTVYNNNSYETHFKKIED